jgi:hypothetical protein
MIKGGSYGVALFVGPLAGEACAPFAKTANAAFQRVHCDDIAVNNARRPVV